jgi:hypothetical protein
MEMIAKRGNDERNDKKESVAGTRFDAKNGERKEDVR